MKKLLVVLIVAVLALWGCQDSPLEKPDVNGVETVSENNNNGSEESSQSSDDEDGQSTIENQGDGTNSDIVGNSIEEQDNSSSQEDTEPSENNEESQETQENNSEANQEGEDFAESSWQYIGQALDTIDKDGKVEIYKEKDRNSEVIYRMQDLEKVELLETLPYGWFKVRLKDGREGYADARYVRTKEIPPHEYTEKVDGYALVFTENDQSLKIYNDGELVMESKGSSGLWDYFTPKGVFEIEKGRRGEWFYVPRFEQGMKHWVGFKGTYLFHSLPFTEDKELIEEEAAKLGQPASHGCIRLPVDVAKYIYDNVPAGSLVLIN